MAKVIMVQGTMSGVGKSVITAGLLRVFSRDGYRAAPFKSQNMALNSYVTHDGLEIGRAQAMQAEAAGIRPEVWMNPVLLKPVNDVGSQVIVNGRVVGNMKAREYFSYKKELWPEIKRAYRQLSENYDIIVIEGAGSPAEINLKENDIVNMGLAMQVKAPVLLAGDIDRGGVFAQLAGTCALLPSEERRLIRGMIYNKFRGDKTLLEPGIRMMEERCHIPCAGVMPWLPLRLPEEDGLDLKAGGQEAGEGAFTVCVVRLPRISNFTDFLPIQEREGVRLSYAGEPEGLRDADCIILPGSKSTISDLLWLRENGMDKEILKAAENGIPVLGICGGLQMLGTEIADPYGLEGQAGRSVPGFGLLPVRTVLAPDKVCRSKTYRIDGVHGRFQGMNGLSVEGYEIHMGRTGWERDGERQEEVFFAKDGVFGTYLHGILDNDTFTEEFLMAAGFSRQASREGGLTEGSGAYRARREREYDRLEKAVREHLDIPLIYRILMEGVEK